ncbi:S41 family peptidase [Alteromonas gracilis]|uniref:S41 family peptidase n=1 Tax=Alteromonas gracilis TaxID=1479524 RepID=UPI00321B6EB4
MNKKYLYLKALSAFPLITLLCCALGGKSAVASEAVTPSTNDNASESLISNELVRRDFDVLYQSLLDTHYNPYAYVSKDTLESHYSSLKAQIGNTPYSPLAATKLFQTLVSSLNNGHTEVDFPVSSYLAYAEAGGTLFPLDLAFENGKALIRANYSGNVSIAKGAQLLSINNVEINHILSIISPLISAERAYFKMAKLEVLSFPRYYWYAFGESDSYTVKILNEGVVSTHSLSPVSVFEGFEEKKDEVLRAQQQLTFYDNVAYLNPGHFSGDEKQFKAFIDEAFLTINTKRSKALIIDLRYNGGGNDSFSDHMVSYIADAPFKWNATFQLRTSERLKEDTREHRDLDNPYWQAILKHEVGERYSYDFDEYSPVAKNKRYSGDVYVLVNRHSHSQASVTAAQIQDYGWATLVGEETGDYPTLYASQFQYALPNTGITVKIAKGYIVRVSGSEAEQGVQPDIVIRDHLLDDEDEILNQFLNRLDH